MAFLMKDTMSRWGVGPKFAVLSLLCTAVIVAVDRHYKPLFSLSFIPHSLRIFAGLLLIVAGIVFNIVAIVNVMSAYKEGRLVTGGVYGVCRHPVYAAWAVFIVPGMVLLHNSWMCLIIPVLMCAMAKRLARTEDDYLETKFGAPYKAYRQSTPSILPLGWLKHGPDASGE